MALAPSPSRLPIVDHLDAICEQARVGNLVLVAEPGAGKTTAVPPALLEAGLDHEGEIVVLAPRRLAARLAAERVAHSLGEPVGERCGYQVRFDAKVSSRTRIRFMTEGLFTRRLRSDPELRGVALVVFDELHERHLDADLALALTRRLQSTRRPELKIVAMSATIDAEPVAKFLEAPVIEVPGRTHPVEISHQRDDGRPLERRVLRALSDEVERGLDGHVLVFLPGAAQIRRCMEACEGYARAHGLELHALHGELDRAAQDRAVAPSGPDDAYRVVFSTNVAETSITIDGVALVIDSGLARIPSHDPWTGISRLDLGPISQASATQRAGRAGRTRAGRCIRLYGRGDLERRRAFDRPEIARLDIASVGLDVAAAGYRVFDDDLKWLDAPPVAAVEAARRVLDLLGATDPNGRLTEVGRRMLAFPLPPRLARLVVEGERRGVGELCADVAAVLAERPISRDPRRRADADAAADPMVDLEWLDGARARRRPGQEIDPGTRHRISRARKQLRRLVERRDARSTSAEHGDTMVCRSLLAAFPDHVALVQAEGEAGDGRRRLALAGGGSAVLSPASFVRSAKWCIALTVDTRAGGGSSDQTMVHAAAAIDPDWLIEDFADLIEERDELRLDRDKPRVISVAELRYLGLLLDRDVRPASPGPETTAVLRTAATQLGAEWFVDREALAQLRLRTRLIHEHDPEFAPIDERTVLEVVLEACEGATNLEQVRSMGILAHLRARLGERASKLDRLAPTHVQLAGGRRLQVHYEVDRPPWVASRLQDFFGATTGPRIVQGRVPLVLHLRAPNNRDVQVTTDLAGFWTRHYPDLRKSLMRRYPKHAWPEDPVSASPPSPSGRRRSR